ncbi:MAG: hypothetical protein OS112_10795 [Methanoregula sp.]|nr:MAG: hypothetical protein OS112_10795 [Methanoregula sp.]
MDPAPVQPQVSKSDQLKNNLKAWSSPVWVFFFGFIPFLLLLVFALPQDIKEKTLIFHTSNLLNLHTLVLNEYTHSQLFPHMIGNMVFYYITILAIFAFENNRKRFFLIAGVSLLLVPVICSFLTLGLWHFFGSDTSGQGFSGINAAFLAYALMIFVTWFLSGKLEQFDHKEAFAGAVWRYYISYIFMTIMVALIVLIGILESQFMPAGNTISNGIAHFGGFITGLIVFLLYDILTEKRKNFDLIVIISIIIGIFYYTDYLIRIVRAVKGL